MDGNGLERETFLYAVAIAAGRKSAGESRPDRSPDKTEAALKPPSRAEAMQQGRLILVAEDNETNQKVILRQLALLGYAADVAGDGREALERWQSGDYALILTDLHMPEMDGYELCLAFAPGNQPAPHPDHRADRQRPQRRGEAMPCCRHGRVPEQTDATGRTASHAGPLAADNPRYAGSRHRLAIRYGEESVLCSTAL